MKLLVFASGRGSNFEAIIKASESGYIKSKISGLICDKDCPAVQIAEKHSIPVSIIKPKDYSERLDYVKSLLSTISSYEPDYIILAGYMRIIPAELIDKYPLKIINIHPSLLPEFPGKDSIRRAWDAKVKRTGVTVHYVNDRMDAGPIIAQRSVDVPDSLEKLEEQMHKIEHSIYPEVIKDLTEKPFDTLLISNCLLGVNCRYDGGNKYSERTITFMNNFKGKVIEVCPELTAGYYVPRPSTDIVNGRAIMKGIGDITEDLQKACDSILSNILGAKRIFAILKEKSPSCGVLWPKGLFTVSAEKKFKEDIFIVSEEDL